MRRIGVENPPSCTLAAFLNITPSSEIDTALQKLLAFPVMQGNSHVIKLAASTFCDWLWIWPKASRVSHWLISLLRMLSTSNNSHIVAEVIDEKLQKVGFSMLLMARYGKLIVCDLNKF